MKTLFEHIQNSIFNPLYYRELLSKRFSFSFKYYWALGVLFSLLLTCLTSLAIIPKLNSVLYSAPEAVLHYYPDELVLTAEKGFITTNVSEPYFLPIPAIIREEVGSQMQFDHAVVIDTKNPFSLAQLAKYRSMVWIGNDFLAYYDDPNSSNVTTKYLDPKMSFVLNEDKVKFGLESIEPYFKFVAPALVLIFLLGYLLMFGAYLLYLLIGALFILLVAKFLKVSMDYGQAYRVGLHAMTAPILLNGMLITLGMSISEIPFLFSVLMLVVVYMNFKVPVPQEISGKAGENEALKPESNETPKDPLQMP
jgi:hypothetical protein